jgi:hypothetical protein
VSKCKQVVGSSEIHPQKDDTKGGLDVYKEPKIVLSRGDGHEGTKQL